MGHVGSRPRAHARVVIRIMASALAVAAMVLLQNRARGQEYPNKDSSSFWLTEPAGEKDAIPGLAVLVHPPQHAEQRRTMVVMLHGMCDPPERECPHFANSITQFAWLVCPRARLPCNGGGTMWDWQGKYATVDGAVERVVRYGEGLVDAESGKILIGFSLGALAAVDIAHRGQGGWSKLLLIGAKVYPNATLLKRAGVRRVLLASGERDMMRWHMTAQARQLDRQGVPSTFMSMGDVGHWFAPDMDGWMAGALAWLDQEDGRS